MRRNQCIYIASVLMTSIALSSISSTSSSPCLRTATAAGLDDVFGEDLEEGLFDDVMVVEEEDVDSLENNSHNNNNNNNAAPTNGSGATMTKNLAESLADLKSLFATGIAVSGACEHELIPPEESCCLPPGASSASGASSKSALSNSASFGFDMVLGGGGQQHECFAPPIDDQEHPWESSPALVEAMRGAMTELNVDEFEKLIASNHFVNDNQNNKNNQKEKVLIIDTRCAAEFVASHVPNAVFGGTGTDQFDRFIGTIHSDHNVPVVFIHTPPFVATPYANAPIPDAASSTLHVAAAAEVEETVAANKAAIEEIAQRLVKAGLSNLRGHLKGGMVPWVEAGKPTVATERWTASTLLSKLLVDKDKIVVKKNFGQHQNQNDDGSASSSFHPQSLVDLREPCASDFSSLPNSESIPVSETVLKEVFHRAQHEKDPNHPLVLYCSNGFRSLMVTSALKALKPDINVVCMENGFDDLENVAEIKTLMGL